VGYDRRDHEPERREMKRGRQITVLGILLISGAIMLGGCGGGGGGGGGGSGSGSGSGARLTREEYAAKANSICAAYNKEYDALGEPKSSAEVIAGIDKLLPLQRTMVASLKALNPPSGEEATATKAIALGEELTTGETALSAALKSGDMAKVGELSAAAEPVSKEADALFRQLGVTECTAR
jgi:hypothetical protein